MEFLRNTKSPDAHKNGDLSPRAKMSSSSAAGDTGTDRRHLDAPQVQSLIQLEIAAASARAADNYSQWPKVYKLDYGIKAKPASQYDPRNISSPPKLRGDANWPF